MYWLIYHFYSSYCNCLLSLSKIPNFILINNDLGEICEVWYQTSLCQLIVIFNILMGHHSYEINT